MRYLRAVSPSTPSNGPVGSLDRAMEWKRRGTAHQCLEHSCWIICSSIRPENNRNSGVRECSGIFSNENFCQHVFCFFFAPLCSDGRLLKKVAMKTWSLAPSSGQSPTLCPTDLHVDRRRVNEDWRKNTLFLGMQLIVLVDFKPPPVEERRFGQNIHEGADDKLRSQGRGEQTLMQKLSVVLPE